MSRHSRAGQIRSPFEVRLLRILRALARELRTAGVPVSQWATASCLDRAHLHRLLRGQGRPSLPTIGQLLDGAWACLGGREVRLELRLSLGGHEVLV